MNHTQYKFYECDNPECGMRFPGYDSYPKYNLCPLCRSKTHVVEIVSPPLLNDHKNRMPKQLKVDVLLDNLRSALNVGSIFRTSDGAGINKIYLCGITPTPENSKVRKTALGAENNIQWERQNNGLAAAAKLQEKGNEIWVLEYLPIGIPLFNVDFNSSYSPIVLVVGNEVTGVDPGIVKICDKVISIPMFGDKRSYNVAIAFGIAISFLLYRSGLFSDQTTV